MIELKEIRNLDTAGNEMFNVSRLNCIVRFNTRHKLHTETVAAHSFYVAYFTMRICDVLKLKHTVKLLAIDAALMHDVPESKINDITYDCKKMITGLSDMLNKYESEIIGNISFDSQRVLFDPCTLAEKLAKAIVIYADILSVKMYAKIEVESGNKLFIGILKDTEERLEKAEATLEELYKQYKGV